MPVALARRLGRPAPVSQAAIAEVPALLGDVSRVAERIGHALREEDGHAILVRSAP